MAFRDLQLVGVFVDILHPVDVRAIQHRVETLRVHVERERDEVDIAGAFAIAEKRALDTVGTGEQAELGGGDAGATVIVRMQRDQDVLAVVELAAHPLDLVGMDVGRRHLDGGRQVDDELVVGRRLHDFGDRVADFQRHLEFGAGEAFGRILETVAAAGLGGHVGDHLGSVGGDLLDAGDVLGEDDPTLQLAGRIIEMDDRAPRAFERLECAGDQFGPALHQHLKRDVVRHAAFLDAPAPEVEVGLRRGREAHLDLLEAHLHERLEHAQLAHGVHRVDQRLVAVAQVDRAPQGRLLDALVGPSPVSQPDRRVGLVLAAGVGHALHRRHVSLCVHLICSRHRRPRSVRRLSNLHAGNCDWQGACCAGRPSRPPGAPSAGPTIADKTEQQKGRGKRANGLRREGGLTRRGYGRALEHGGSNTSGPMTWQVRDPGPEDQVLIQPATSRASEGPSARTMTRRALCSAMTKDRSTLSEAAAMIATESMPPGLVAR